jgi:hypothetical protein
VPLLFLESDRRDETARCIVGARVDDERGFRIEHLAQLFRQSAPELPLVLGVVDQGDQLSPPRRLEEAAAHEAQLGAFLAGL